MKLTDDIYVYEWTNYFDNNCNSFYIGGGINALVDPGLTRYLPNLLERMADDGIKREDIAYVINTHSHPDHSPGAFVLQELCRAHGCSPQIHGLPSAPTGAGSPTCSRVRGKTSARSASRAIRWDGLHPCTGAGSSRPCPRRA